MEFNFKNPNSSLTTYGIIYMLIVFISYLISPAVSVGFAFVVKIFVLLWIPRAAALAGRNPKGWTIFCFFIPSVGLISLGTIGYKEIPAYKKLIEECTKWLNDYAKKLQSDVDEQKMDYSEKERLLEEYLTDLQDFADRQLAKIYKTDDDSFLTEQLQKKGYVLNSESDVFVDVGEVCPACGMRLNKEDKECPDCGLTLFPE